VSIYAGTQTERDYRAGVDDGRRWAQQDLDAYAVTHSLEMLRGEVETWRKTLGLRAYYLGALRGYRESTRTQDTRGRWGT
jgi:hypothetical protein